MFDDNGVITPETCFQRVAGQPNPTIYLAPGWEIATTHKKEAASGSSGLAENSQKRVEANIA